MDIGKKFATDDSYETQGRWVILGEGAELKIARTNTTRYKEVFRKTVEPYRQAIEMKTMDDKTGDELLCKVYAECILVDWKGLQEGGKAVPYSKELAYEYLTKFPDFRAFVKNSADQADLFRKGLMETQMGNSTGG